MRNEIINVVKALLYFRSVVGQKRCTIRYFEFFLRVIAAGDMGVTTVEIASDMRMVQSISSKVVKDFSQYIDKNNKLVGLNLIMGLQNDLHYRRRQRLYLTNKGKKVAEKIKELLNE